MKRALFLILIIAFPSITLAEDEHENLLNSDIIWVIGYFSPYDEHVSYIESKLGGDTLIGNIVFKKRFEKVLNQGEERVQEWKATDYFVGQNGGEVYYYDKSSNKEPQLLMDFSAKSGTIIPYIFGGMPSILRIENVSDTVFICSTDKQTRRCIYVRGIETNESDIWVEGIGSIKYGIESFFLEPITGGIPILVKCYKGDIIMYENPFPTNSNHPINQNRVKYFTLYNLQGQRVESALRKGVYIQNGKKVVIK